MNWTQIIFIFQWQRQILSNLKYFSDREFQLVACRRACCELLRADFSRWEFSFCSLPISRAIEQGPFCFQPALRQHSVLHTGRAEAMLSFLCNSFFSFSSLLLFLAAQLESSFLFQDQSRWNTKLIIPFATGPKSVFLCQKLYLFSNMETTCVAWLNLQFVSSGQVFIHYKLAIGWADLRIWFHFSKQNANTIKSSTFSFQAHVKIQVF